MKSAIGSLIALCSAILLAPVNAPGEPVGSAFTYQAQLKQNGVPAQGTCDFRFTLWTDSISVNAADRVGPVLAFDADLQSPPPLDVKDGLFAVELDFGSMAFKGDKRWLEVAVRCPSAPLASIIPYTTLTPRSLVNSTPYAMYSLDGENAVSAFWATSTDDIYNLNSGNVGIGTTAPSASLHVTNSGGKTAILGETSWVGVYGRHASTSGSFPGVWGETDSLSANATALRGIVTSTSPGSGSVGVLGLNNGTGGAGMGVKGQQDGSGWGVFGTTPSGTGVYGLASGGSGTNYGVRGSTASPSGFGGHFRNTGSDGTALYAESAGAGRTRATLQVHNTRATAGMAAYVTGVGSWSTMHVQNNGDGEVLWLSRNNSDGPFIVANNEETGGRVFTVHPNGWTTVSILEITGGADLSEQFQIAETQGPPKPGMVVSIDPENPGQLVVSRDAYDRKVAGIISGAGGVNPGMLMSQKDTITDGEHPVALSGRVYAWCDATRHSINVGDMLTSSHVPGHAMSAVDHAKAQGAIIGKAMTSLKSGKGLVLVLITLQ